MDVTRRRLTRPAAIYAAASLAMQFVVYVQEEQVIWVICYSTGPERDLLLEALNEHRDGLGQPALTVAECVDRWKASVAYAMLNSPPSEGTRSRTGVSDGGESPASLPDAGTVHEGTTNSRGGRSQSAAAAHPAT